MNNLRKTTTTKTAAAVSLIVVFVFVSIDPGTTKGWWQRWDEGPGLRMTRREKDDVRMMMKGNDNTRVVGFVV